MKSRQKIEISCNDPSFVSEFCLFMYKISFHGNRIKATILRISDHQSDTRSERFARSRELSAHRINAHYP